MCLQSPAVPSDPRSSSHEFGRDRRLESTPTLKIPELSPSFQYFDHTGAGGSEEHVRNVPPETDAAARKSWMKARWSERQSAEANRFRDFVIARYGEERGKAVKFAETFEFCEYGSRPTGEEIRRLFPFFKDHDQ